MTMTNTRLISSRTHDMVRSLPLVIAVLTILQGCAVFEPVGSFFSQGYRNTVAYFNAYYNASRLYTEAEEEYLKALRTHEQAVRDGAAAQFKVPPAAVTKFNSVIDKCSNILTFQAESDFVQDALFLIARSYDYLGETVKAERKYAELLAQFPESDYRVEAVARLGGVLMAQDRGEEALVLLEQAEVEAVSSSDEEVLPFILERLAVLHRDAGEYDRAHAYYARLHDMSAESEELVRPLIDYTRLQLDVGRPDEALKIARALGDLTDDPFYLYDARALEVKALRQLGRQEDALVRIEESLEDFRFLQQQGAIRLLRAEVLFDMGRTSEAIDEYTLIDTVYTRRPPAASAAFALGKYYASRGQYTEARAAFERGSGVSGAPAAAQSRRRAVEVTRYIALQAKYWQTDSVLTALLDSVGTDPDARVDSMRTLLGAVMQDMGDWHFADGDALDSAYTWLSRSVDFGKKRPGQARALFILADIAATDSTQAYGDPEEFYRKLDAEFPQTAYAEEARRRLGIIEETADDPGFGMYRAGEEALAQGQPGRAARIFDSLGSVYPTSSYAVRGTFAAGWVYEYLLAEQDSAALRYDRVVRSGESGSFVQEARTRLAKIGPLPKDSTSTAPADTTGRMSPTEGARDQQRPQPSPAVIKQ